MDRDMNRAHIMDTKIINADVLESQGKVDNADAGIRNRDKFKNVKNEYFRSHLQEIILL